MSAAYPGSVSAAEFNAAYPVGTLVFAYPGARPEDMPSATRLVTRTRSEASVLGGHTDVVWVAGHSACIALSHVDVVTQAEWAAALTAEAETAREKEAEEKSSRTAADATPGEDYPGETDMLRGLVATLRAVAEHGDLADVQKLLTEHASDDAAARQAVSS